jgi:hypothetical protein
MDEKKILVKSDYILVKKCEDFGAIEERPPVVPLAPLPKKT